MVAIVVGPIVVGPIVVGPIVVVPIVVVPIVDVPIVDVPIVIGQVVIGQVVIGRVVIGQVVIGQVVIGQVVIGQVVIGQVVIGQVVIGQVVIGQVVIGQVVIGQVVIGRVVIGQVVIGRVVIGQVVIGQVVIGQVVIGRVVIGQVVIGRVVIGQVVIGRVVIGQVVIGPVVFGEVGSVVVGIVGGAHVLVHGGLVGRPCGRALPLLLRDELRHRHAAGRLIVERGLRSRSPPGRTQASSSLSDRRVRLGVRVALVTRLARLTRLTRLAAPLDAGHHQRRHADQQQRGGQDQAHRHLDRVESPGREPPACELGQQPHRRCGEHRRDACGGQPPGHRQRASQRQPGRRTDTDRQQKDDERPLRRRRRGQRGQQREVRRHTGERRERGGRGRSGGHPGAENPGHAADDGVGQVGEGEQRDADARPEVRCHGPVGRRDRGCPDHERQQHHQRARAEQRHDRDARAAGPRPAPLGDALRPFGRKTAGAEHADHRAGARDQPTPDHRGPRCRRHLGRPRQ